MRRLLLTPLALVLLTRATPAEAPSSGRPVSAHPALTADQIEADRLRQARLRFQPTGLAPLLLANP